MAQTSHVLPPVAALVYVTRTCAYAEFPAFTWLTRLLCFTLCRQQMFWKNTEHRQCAVIVAKLRTALAGNRQTGIAFLLLRLGHVIGIYPSASPLPKLCLSDARFHSLTCGLGGQIIRSLSPGFAKKQSGILPSSSNFVSSRKEFEHTLDHPRQPRFLASAQE